MVKDLARAGVSNSLRIAKDLQREARKEVDARRSRICREKVKSGQLVSVIRHRHSLDVTLRREGGKRPRLLKLNHEHYDKLRCIWSGGAAVCDDEASFHNDLYSLLARYHALQGHGFQAACPEKVFEVLQEQFDVSFECFAYVFHLSLTHTHTRGRSSLREHYVWRTHIAHKSHSNRSPMNCYFGRYCSAFPDVDSPFGSDGSFWNWNPPSTGGSFQANRRSSPTENLSLSLSLSHTHTDVECSWGTKLCRAIKQLRSSPRSCKSLSLSLSLN